MANYYKESIERITEQMIEKEVLKDIEEVKVYTIGENNDAGKVGEIKSDILEYIEENKTELASFGNGTIKSATQTYEDIVEIKENTDDIDKNTIAEIEHNIRQMIVDNGYIMKIVDDGNGNADIVLTTEVN